MAPGYCIAIGLEACGLLAFALGALLTRYERRSKSVGLRRFLASGHVAEAKVVVATAPPPVRSRLEPAAPRMQDASSPRPRIASEAALALRSAFAAPIR